MRTGGRGGESEDENRVWIGVVLRSEAGCVVYNLSREVCDGMEA